MKTEILLILEGEFFVELSTTNSMTAAFRLSVLPWCLLHLVISVNVPPGHQRDGKKSENSISVCKTTLLSLTSTIVFSM